MQYIVKQLNKAIEMRQNGRISYDIKFRKRTLEYLEDGRSWKEIAAVFGVCEASFGRLVDW